MENAFVTLGEIARVAKRNYMRTGRRTDFVEIVRYLKSRGEVHDTPVPFRSWQRFLSPEEFLENAYMMEVDAGRLLAQTEQDDYIFEDAVAQSDRDIFAMVHLPYIDAEMHSHNYFELNYVCKGSLTQYFEHEKQVFGAGDLVIIAPDSPHIVSINGDSFVVSMNIRRSTFDKVFWQLLNTNDMLSAFFTHSLYRKGAPSYLSFHIEESERYEMLIQQIFQEMNRRDDYANTMAVSYLNIFFGEILREFGGHIHLYSDGRIVPSHRSFPLIMRYTRYNYATVTLPELAQIFHYSQVHISRMFRKYLDEPFSVLIQNLKLFHAKNYLETTDFTLEQIAQMVGYESPDYLSRIFKKKYGETPSEFRRHCERKRVNIVPLNCAKNATADPLSVL